MNEHQDAGIGGPIKGTPDDFERDVACRADARRHEAIHLAAKSYGDVMTEEHAGTVVAIANKFEAYLRGGDSGEA